MRRIAVLDIGKTNAKVLVVDLATGAEEVLARTPERGGARGALSASRHGGAVGLCAVRFAVGGSAGGGCSVDHHAWGGLCGGG